MCDPPPLHYLSVQQCLGPHLLLLQPGVGLLELTLSDHCGRHIKLRHGVDLLESDRVLGSRYLRRGVRAVTGDMYIVVRRLPPPRPTCTSWCASSPSPSPMQALRVGCVISTWRRKVPPIWVELETCSITS